MRSTSNLRQNRPSTSLVKRSRKSSSMNSLSKKPPRGIINVKHRSKFMKPRPITSTLQQRPYILQNRLFMMQTRNASMGQYDESRLKAVSTSTLSLMTIQRNEKVTENLK